MNTGIDEVKHCNTVIPHYKIQALDPDKDPYHIFKTMCLNLYQNGCKSANLRMEEDFSLYGNFHLFG